MSQHELAAAAEQLARDCVLLKKSGVAESFAGVWGGLGIVPAPEGPFRHWLSIDCRFFPAGLGPSMGILSVYTNEDDTCVSGVATHDPMATLSFGAGEPLFAFPGR